MAKDHRTRIIIGTALVLGVLAAGFLANRPQQAPAWAATTAAMHPTVTINAKLGETFAPRRRPLRPP